MNRPAHPPAENASRRGREEKKEKPAAVVDPDYEKWEEKNYNTISKVIVTTFPKYFLFFVFCVGFTASRAPTGFAVGLTYSMILVRIVQVYSYYYYNKIAIAGSLITGASINVLLLFTGLVHKY